MLLSVVDCGAVGLPLFPPLGAGDDGEIVVRIVLLEDDLEIVQCTVPFISRNKYFFVCENHRCSAGRQRKARLLLVFPRVLLRKK